MEPGHRLVDVDAALSVGYLHSAMQVLHVALDKWALQKSEAQLWKPSRVKETKPPARQQKADVVLRAAQRKLKVFTSDILQLRAR